VDPTNRRRVLGGACMRRISGRPLVTGEGDAALQRQRDPSDERMETDTNLLEPALGWLRQVRPRRPEHRCHPPSRPRHTPESLLASQCWIKRQLPRAWPRMRGGSGEQRTTRFRSCSFCPNPSGIGSN
jgi:hypothetical protein